MAHRERQRVGGVVGQREALVEAERAAHHEFHLRLVGMTEGRDRELYLVGRIFEKRETAIRRREHNYRARFAQPKRALHVLANEVTFQAYDRRIVVVDYDEKFVVNLLEAIGTRR
jgi:UDP-2,3-diacylglucosamine pyrophosphatase LpxH